MAAGSAGLACTLRWVLGMDISNGVVAVDPVAVGLVVLLPRGVAVYMGALWRSAISVAGARGFDSRWGGRTWLWCSCVS